MVQGEAARLADHVVASVSGLAHAKDALLPVPVAAPVAMVPSPPGSTELDSTTSPLSG